MKYSFLLSAVLSGTAFFSQAQEKPELVVTTGHIATVNVVCYHPAGSFILTASDDHAVKIWDRSLQQEFRTLYGHTDAVVNGRFSPDGKFIATADRRKLIVWTFPEGQVVRKVSVDNQNTCLGFTGDSKSVILNADNDSIVQVNFQTGSVKNLVETADATFHVDPVLNLLINEHRNRDGEEGVMFDVTDLSSGKTTLIKNVPDNVRCYASHAKTRTLAAYSDVSNEISIIDLASGSVKKRFPLKGIVNQNVTKDMEFSKDGTTLYVIGYDCGIRLINVATGQLVKEFTELKNTGKTDFSKPYRLGIFMNDIDVSPDGKSLGTTINYISGKPGEFQQNIQGTVLWDIASGKASGELKGMSRILAGVFASKSKPLLITTNTNPNFGYKQWNLKDGSVESSRKSLMFAGATAGGDTIALRYLDSIIVIDLVTNQRIYSVPAKTSNYISLSEDGKLLAYGMVDMTVPSKPESVIDIYDVAARKKVTTVRTGVIGRSMPVQIANDKKHVIAIDVGVGFFSWNIASGKKVADVKIETSSHRVLCQVPGKTSILVSRLYDEGEGNFTNQCNILEYDYISGQVKSTFKPGFKGWAYSGDFSDDGKKLVLGTGGLYDSTEFIVTVIDWDSKNSQCRLEGMYGNVNHVYFGHDGKTLFSGGDDGMVRQWSLDECRQTGTFIGMNDLDYIIFTPDNYYKCSKGNYNGVCFRLNGRLYTFEQFDLVYNRPDLVMAQLGAPKTLTMMYKLAWTKRIKRAGFTEEMLSGKLDLPDLELPDKTGYATSTSDPKLKVKFRTSDRTYNLDRVNVYVNEVPVYGLNGISLRDKKVKSFEQEVELELCSGKNLVQVFSVNEKGLESLKESFEIECKKPVTKPDLYILGVGVSHYADKNYNLKYATKDMNDFVSMMQGSGNYGKVIVRKIADSLATKENIIMNGKLFADANVDDHVIIYFSCHGLLDEKLDYYLATADVVFNEPSGKGMPYDEIEKMLDACRSRNRLVLIDACHSGEVDKSDLQITNEKNPTVTMTKSGGVNVKPKAGLKNSFSYMQALFSDVSKGSGAVVISAAAGAEFALESNEWNNGVFTYCILNGFKSGDADTDKDKVISISEMKNYVITHVADLTKGAQVPTVRKENSYNDFPVYKKGQ